MGETVPDGELTTRFLHWAYRQGCFPMTVESGEIRWFLPTVRALFPIAGIRVSRSLAKTLRRREFDVRFDTRFEAVMRGCLRPGDNWISEPLIQLYVEAYHEGWAHCAEVWRGEQLVGGVYGLAIGGCFCAESMFHLETDMSKVALWALVNRCRELGFVLFDAQIMNPHLASLGAYESTHESYMLALKRAEGVSTPWSNRFR
ncbi:MAG: leucyl/phenylalanyl-tRNA--protein transferase [Fimbriimonadaceae bacterium]|nr:leucyl/phenylalanyl-tRNA--protein transferase [Fimbriimonadaceae bacterium]